MIVSYLAMYIALPLISFSVVVTFFRLMRGPSLPDRVVALDLMTTLGIGIITTFAMGYDDPIFVDIAVVIALLSFLGTIAFAYYVMRRVRP